MMILKMREENLQQSNKMPEEKCNNWPEKTNKSNKINKIQNRDYQLVLRLFDLFKQKHLMLRDQQMNSRECQMM